MLYKDAPVSAVLCPPDCLHVRRSVPWPGPHMGTRQKRSIAAEVPNPSEPLGVLEETNEYPDPENLKSIAKCRGGP